MPTASELTVNTSATAMDMTNTMFGDGVTVVSASYSGAGGASGNVALEDDTLITSSEIENIICFTPGTRILTP